MNVFNDTLKVFSFDPIEDLPLNLRTLKNHIFEILNPKQITTKVNYIS